MESLYLKQLFYELPFSGLLVRPELQKALWQEISSQSKVNYPKEEEVWLPYGNIADKIGVLLSGKARACYYSERHGYFVTLTLYKAPAVLVAANSFFYAQPSQVSIEIIEGDAQLISLTRPKVQHIRQQFPDTQVWVDELLMKRHQHFLNRTRNLLELSLKEHYLYETLARPGFLESFEKQHQASYFGVSKQVFSRMLAGLTKKE